MDWKAVIMQRSCDQQGFRPIFIKMLESYTGDYVSYESQLKIKISDDSFFEAELKTSQTETKNTNLLYSKNFSVLVEALKLVFEVMLVDKHAAKLIAMFNLTDIHDLKSGFAVNFVTYFINRHLCTVMRQPAVSNFVAAIIAEQASEAEAKEFTDAINWFDCQKSSFVSYSTEKIEYHYELKLPSEQVDVISSHIMNEKDDQMANGVYSKSILSFKEADSKELLCGYLKQFTELWHKSASELTSKKTPTKALTSSKPGSPTRAANGSNSEITVNFQVLKELDSKAHRLAKVLSNLFTGSEILRVELFRALMEFNLFRKDLKREKKEIISSGLTELARESNTLLTNELQSIDGSGIDNELDPRECILCRGKDRHPVGGRLVHFKKHDWIHCNCALWSEGVTEVLFGGLEVYQAIKKARVTMCPECGTLGGSLTGTVDPTKRFHLACAIKNKCIFTFSASDRKVYNPEVWIKNNLSVYQKHYKHSNPIYFIFCTSMELITSFKATKRLYIVKKQLKGVLPDTVKSDCIADIDTSIGEMHLRKKSEAGSESLTPRPTISRIGGLIIVSMLEKTSRPDFHKTSQLISKLRHQFMLSLRRDMLSTTELYTEGKRDIYSLMLHKWIVARQLPKSTSESSDSHDIDFEVYTLDSDLEKPHDIFTLKTKVIPGRQFEMMLAKFYNQEESVLNLPDDSWQTVDPKDQIDILFSKMGLCYGEVRSYLLSTLKASLEKLRQSQHNFKNYADFQQVFYQSGLEQHIMLDIEEKHSIYDRLKLIWQINSELEASRDFQRDSRYIHEKQHLGCRSRLNPKSRSFNKGSAFQIDNNDNYRHAEKLLLQMTNQRANSQGQEAINSASGLMKKKLNPVHKPSEKSSSLLKKGYLTYKTLNTMVAPSKIHKYGRRPFIRSLCRQDFSEGRIRDRVHWRSYPGACCRPKRKKVQKGGIR